MKSNVYLAFGQIGGVPVMKVGKANDLKRREKQLRIDVEFSLACVSEGDALVFEDRLREHAFSLGASSFRGYDWFYYDDNVYEALKAILIEFGSDESVLKLEREVAQYQLRYHQMKVESLEAQVEQLQEEKRFLQQQKDAEVERILRESSQREGALREQIGELKAMLRMYRERDDGNQ